MTDRILIVDDDASIVRITALYMRKSGYEPEAAADGRAALDMLENGEYALILLDLMLPKLNGWEVCRKLRAEGSRIPVIMMTARGQLEERIEGLQLGADDYIVKPFDPRELMARVDAVLRRSRGGQPPASGAACRAGNLRLDAERRSVTLGGRMIDLPRREFDLLQELIRHPGLVCSRSELIERIWGLDFEGDDRVVDLYVQRLRRRLQPAQGWSISTVWGVGYKLDRTDEA
ncbi:MULTISPECIES: response regulator transcription factor [unclassified Paenibacillus]|uniref:response regulator transcription factor n=1 Tax=unclassified Paenibacillus TaxID=185978 RepID=UPI000954E590|nr:MULTISPECIES: response regulator transcription factor [unclassified Paenibacillus]SIR34236.1 two-component system, OmpR family, alkaline phosphatase synthesis response regulator PhoP [Paenibacillus sp. RU4X]SIR45034.1 two-component system, OmpR family, alkaline phosphatase synthesis response regulator PhoP [Paenibacillus sp. RU4T]